MLFLFLLLNVDVVNSCCSSVFAVVLLLFRVCLIFACACLLLFSVLLLLPLLLVMADAFYVCLRFLCV